MGNPKQHEFRPQQNQGVANPKQGSMDEQQKDQDYKSGDQKKMSDKQPNPGKPQADRRDELPAHTDEGEHAETQRKGSYR